jgi:hypothetical protein
MAKKTWKKIAFVSVSLVLFVGCAYSLKKNMYLHDLAPHEIHKGYIEFYLGGPVYWPTAVYKDQNGKTTWLGNIGSIDERTKVVVADLPGYSSYTVKHGGAVKTVTVEVVQGMITPVSVNFQILGSKREYGGFVASSRYGGGATITNVTTTFTMDVTPGTPYPFRGF